MVESLGLYQQHRPWLKRLALIMALCSSLCVILITAFVVRTELAHDEVSCPFSVLETREVAAHIFVQEETRRCLPDVEEHRWIVQRQASAKQSDVLKKELGRWRLPAERYEAGYVWEVSVGERGVRLNVETASDTEQAEYFELPHPHKSPKG